MSWMTDRAGAWTLESLKEYVDSLFEAERRALKERHDATQVALTKAESLLADYKNDSNDYRNTFLPKDEYNVRHEQLREQLGRADDARNLLANRVMALESRAGYISAAAVMAALSLVLTATTVLIGFFHFVK